MSGYWSWLREKGARSWGFCPPPFFSLVNRRLCAGWEREACEQPAPFRRERHAHIDPANKRAHTQNSSTPTLTPAGEDIANTIAESKPRQRRSMGFGIQESQDVGRAVFPWTTYSTFLILTFFSCKDNYTLSKSCCLLSGSNEILCEKCLYKMAGLPLSLSLSHTHPFALLSASPHILTSDLQELPSMELPGAAFRSFFTSLPRPPHPCPRTETHRELRPKQVVFRPGRMLEGFPGSSG